jgi:flagellar hook-length control protein FliK
MSAPNDFQFNISNDGDVRVTENSGTELFASSMNNNLEESADSDSHSSHMNSSMEDRGDGKSISAVNAVSSEEQVMEEEVMDQLMLTLYSVSVMNEHINVGGIEVDTEDITVNAESGTNNANQVQVPEEEMLSEENHVDSPVNKSGTNNANQVQVPEEEMLSEENHVDSSVNKSGTNNANQVQVPEAEMLSEKNHVDSPVNKKVIAVSTKDELATLEIDSGIDGDDTSITEKSRADMKCLFSEDEDASDLKNMEFESEKFAKLNLTEDSQDADPEEEIHIRTDHGRQSKSGYDSDNSDFNENKQNSGMFQNKIATDGASQFPFDRHIKNVEKLTPERAPVAHVDTELVNTNAIDKPDAFTEGSRSTGSIFTKNVARAAGFNDVLDRIVYVIKGNNRLGVSVEHDLLGKININLSMEKGMVHVHINASEKIASEFLEENLHYLMEELSQEGVNVGGFSFGMTDDNNEQGEHSGNEGSMSKDYETGQDDPGSRTSLISIFA